MKQQIYICLYIVPVAFLLVHPVHAQKLLETNRLTNRSQFYSSALGTLAFLPQVTRSEEAKYAGQWNVFVESGRYKITPRGQYCFVLNHRDRAQAGRRSYVMIGALSILHAGTEPRRPISMFRNQGWSRDHDSEYFRENNLPKHVSLTPKAFIAAHDLDELEKNDQLLTHRWHGNFGAGESWADRDLWLEAASVSPELITTLAGAEVEQSNLRFDAKLLRFKFTGSRNTNQPVAFCMEGDRRIATILTVFSPHFHVPERRFELMFR